MTPPAKTNVRMLFALTLVHFTGDFYSSFISPLFPLFVDRLGLTLTQVGVIAGVSRILAFIVQPSVGYLADRYPTRHFMLVGLMLPVLCIPLTGAAPGFLTLLFLTAAGSFGSAMFHPSLTGLVPVYAGRNAGFSMSVFNTGGTLAFGVGPLFVTWYAAHFGLSALPYTMVFGLVAAAYLYGVLPMPAGEGLRHLGFWGSIRESLGPAWKAVTLIWAVMVLRAFVGQSFMTFMPVHFVEQGYSVVAAGVVFAIFTVAGTVSGLLAGLIADRIGFKPVFLFCHLLMTPVLVLFLQMEGVWVYLGSALSGGFVLATLPIGVTLAQTLAPRGRSMVASLMMGFAFGLGGAVSPVVGRLADVYSIHDVLTVMSLVPLLTVPLVMFFPRVSHATSWHSGSGKRL